MLDNRQLGLIKSIQFYCQRIVDTLRGVDSDDFVDNLDKIDIVTHNLFQIGETSKRLDASITEVYGRIPWKEVNRMRDKIAHHYDTVEPLILFNTGKFDIPPLLEVCDEILDEYYK